MPYTLQLGDGIGYLPFCFPSLQNLCVTAAFRPLDEIMEKEKKVHAQNLFLWLTIFRRISSPSSLLVSLKSLFFIIQEKSLAIAEGRPEPPLYGTKDIRPLEMDDFKFALGQVRES